MSWYCCVPGCNSYKRRDSCRNKTFHRIPVTPIIRREWVVKIRRDIGPHFQITENTRVCADHFTENCFTKTITGRKNLKEGTVPTLFAWSSKPDRRKLNRTSSKQVLEALRDHDYLEETLSVEEHLDAAQREIAHLEEENQNLRRGALLSSSMMQAGVCLRQDTEKTQPELTEQHRIRQKEEGSIHMAKSETKCAAPRLHTLEPECVTAHSGVSVAQHTCTSLIKAETDLGSTHSVNFIKTESLESSVLGYVTYLHHDQIKTETDDGGYLKAEHISNLQNIDCINTKSEQIKCESSESLVSDLMNTMKTGAGVDHKDQAEPWQCAGVQNPNCKTEEIHYLLTSANLNNQCDTNNENNLTRIGQKNKVDVEIHIGEKPYKCPQCGKCFSQMRCLNSHLIIHTGKTPHKCTHCDKCFNTKYCLNTHMRIHTGDKPHKCTQCEKCFSQRSNLISHQRIHTGEKPYKCTECGKCFSTLSNLNIHQRIHTGEKPCKCIQCGKCYRSNSSLNVHLRIHTGEMRYNCMHCDKCFNRSSSLNTHLRTHTGEKPYKCTQCEKCFGSNYVLHLHLRIHTGEKPYKCTQCGKCFSTISGLNIHLRIHTGEKPYKCIQCGKCFRSNSSLNVHLRIHKGEMPFKCTHCDKCFNTKSFLNAHQKIHTGKKPYKCTQCGKCFFTMSELNIHQRIHTSEKLHTCTLCGKCFSTMSNLYIHQRVHTGERPYKCIQCGKCYSTSSGLNKHFLTISHLNACQIINSGEKS